MNYSLLGRDVEQDTIPFMQHVEIGMTVWSPLAGGFLSGKYNRDNLKDQENRLAGFDLLPFDKDIEFQVVGVLHQLASTHDCTVAQVALAWLLAKPIVSSILIGASKITQLQDNLRAVELNLKKEEIRSLDDLTKSDHLYPHWFNEMLIDSTHKALFHKSYSK